MEGCASIHSINSDRYSTGLGVPSQALTLSCFPPWCAPLFEQSTLELYSRMCADTSGSRGREQ
jgi:hypothetical protein